MNARRIGLAAWGVAIVIILAGAFADAAGLRINTTASLPRGLWRVVATPEAVRVGDVVTFCPPLNAAMELARDRGYVAGGACPGAIEPMMKPVVAMGGDTVEMSAQGVAVNGMAITRSASLPRDGAGRPLPLALPGPIVVSHGQIWVVSSHSARSFDSRYFGPISRDHLTAILRPVWTEAAP
ncbi:MAG: conjugative transfer signal peptidase TraF [Rhodospirillaceae bacterium]|nr:conjugative transfer signal peptidase TraF [Rhodospirillales bacterium]